MAIIDFQFFVQILFSIGLSVEKDPKEGKKPERRLREFYGEICGRMKELSRKL